MLTATSRIAKAAPSVARAALLVAGCLAAAAAITWGRSGRPGPEPRAEAPPSAEPPPSSDASEGFRLTEPQRRGKQIYSTGISPTGGPMMAVLGNSTSEIPAAVLKCVNCHLQDGRGKPEGGITPSNIRWDELTKPYGSGGALGRKRPPYDASLLKRSITMGFDPAGRSLDQAMPRYRMSHGDLADLVAYLMVLGRESDPGLSADRIRIGVIVAPSRLLPERSHAVRSALTAFVSEINRAGGVYQRKIDLCFAEAAERRADRAEEAVEFAKRERVFALAASFIAGAEAEVARRLDEEGVPLVGAQTLFPQTGPPWNRRVFYLTAGLQGQCRALVRFAHDRRGEHARGAVLLLPEAEAEPGEGAGGADLAGLARSIESGCADLGWTLQQCSTPSGAADARAWAGRLAGTKTAVVFSLLTAEQDVQFLEAAAALGWYPDCFLPGDLVGRRLLDAPRGFDRRIFLSFDSVPSQFPAGLREHGALAEEYRLPDAQLAAQFEAMAAMKALVQALQQAGAGLSREGLIDQLETFREHRTGFAPPLTFGPNRRVGAIGSHIVTIDLIDKKLVSASDWVDGSATSNSGS
jgi:ABC-type branched-subunit amino acid transport system substrate-binding protein